MICVECSSEVPSLYTRFANDYIKLAYCNVCNSVCDKYVEFDLVILFIDILLLKPQAYKHLVFNTLLDYERSIIVRNKEESEQNSNGIVGFLKFLKKQFIQFKIWTHSATHLVRLTISFILFEVYLYWAYQEIQPENTRLYQRILSSPTLSQYAIFFIQYLTEFFINHLTIQLFIYWIYGRKLNNSINKSTAILMDPITPTNSKNSVGKINFDSSSSSSRILYSKEAISATILIAGGTKFYPILMIIWPYESPIYTTLINHYFTNLTLIEALRITIGISFGISLMIVIVAAISKKLCSLAVLVVLCKSLMLRKEFANDTFEGLYLGEINEILDSGYGSLKTIRDVIYELF